MIFHYILITVPAFCYGKCFDGWSEFQQKCVRIFDHESEGLPHHLNWFEAKDHCASEGAYLARFDNAEMNEWVCS